MARPPGRTSGPSRRLTGRLESGRTRTQSSRAWLERQVRDPVAAEARARGFRSRSAFKLIELDQRFDLMRPGQRIVDLGCAPGGWLQAALEHSPARLVGVDLLPVEPLAGAILLQGDFRDPDVQQRLVAALGAAPRLVLSDMAPNATGHRRTDQLRSIALVEAATEFAIAELETGGTFVTKAFQGAGTEEAVKRLESAFARVRYAKPKASRGESAEVYLIAQGLRGARAG
ncbi:MAG TPA: RlmE family RNA methyltransferase [Caulobacteraceae bacterium]|nr:RlmE family RNA methyltransferase [Caulobacteraceae bacterium]